LPGHGCSPPLLCALGGWCPIWIDSATESVRSLPRLVGLAIAFPIAVALSVPLMIAGSLWIEALLGRGADLTGTVAGRALTITWATVFVSLVSWAALTPYCVLLRIAIRRHIAEVRCSRCGYLLIGLPVREGNVVCPECGSQHHLVSEGLQEADVAKGAMARESETPEPKWIGRRGAFAGAALTAVALMWVLTGWPWLWGVAVVCVLCFLATIPIHAPVVRP
jgi:hypothetical protein